MRAVLLWSAACILAASGCSGGRGSRSELAQKRKIEEVLADLESGDADVRSRGAYDLRYYCREDARAEAELFKALGDQDRHVRTLAALSLAHRPSEHTAPGLVRALDLEDELVRYFCATALARLGLGTPRSVAVLLESLERHPAVSSCALDDFRRLGPAAKNCAPALRGIVKDHPERDVKVAAARALWYVTRDSKEVVPLLTTMLRHPVPGRQAALALGEMGPAAAEAVPALAEALRNREDPDHPCHWERRLCAATALREIGPASLPALRAALKDPTKEVRRHAAESIGGIGAAAGPALPDLEKALDDRDREVSAAARVALRRIRNRLKGPRPNSPLGLDIETVSFDWPRNVEVTVSNLCPNDVRLWDTGCSRGYYSYSFVASNSETGRTYHLSRLPTSFTEDFPDAYVLPPGGTKTVAFDLLDGTWGLDGHWAIPKELHKWGEEWALRVEFFTDRSDEARMYRVLTGGRSSNWIRFARFFVET